MEDGLDAVFLTSLEAIRYYSGFDSVDGCVLITKTCQYLFTDFRYKFDALKKAPDYELCLIQFSGEKLYDLVKNRLAEHECKACGFEEDNVSFSLYNSYLSQFRVDLIPYGNTINSLRLIKDQQEILYLQNAQTIADKSYAEFISFAQPGMTEKELAAELDYICRKNGSEGPSFDTIIGSGPNGACCHAVPSERKIIKGDLVVVDFGCVCNGYHSDMTRTFGVVDIDEELKKIYDICLEAHQRALHALQPGITGKELDSIARDYISSYGYGNDFGHSLGHGFGLLIHENPRASVLSDDVFVPGMTITIEPGIYLENHGGVRIEDCCVVTETGYLDFVSTNKDLVFVS